MTEPVAAPNGARPKVAAPAVFQQRPGIDEVAMEALGAPQEGREGEVRRAAADRFISVDELRSVWGLRPEQLEGLSALDVVWRDGLDEEELETIRASRNAVKDMFQKLFGKNIPDKVFDKIWKLALEGKLDKGSWNDLMKQYGFKMRSESFRVLLGGLNGREFTNEKTIESVGELEQALKSLIATMELKRQPTGDEQQDEKLVADYPVYMKRLCSARRFNIWSIDKAGGPVMQVLESIAKKRWEAAIKLLDKYKLGEDKYKAALDKLNQEWEELQRMFKGQVAEKVGKSPELMSFISRHKRKYSYDDSDGKDSVGKLVIKGKMSKDEKKELLAIYPGKEEQEAIIKLFDRSQDIKGELLGRIKTEPGGFGEHLQKIAGFHVTDWPSFLVALLNHLGEAVSKGIASDTDEAQQLERGKRMRYINDILSNGGKDAAALLREVERIFNGEKPDFDYDRVRRGGE